MSTLKTSKANSEKNSFCERNSHRPPGFSMSRDSFLAIEKSFHLPPSTLESAFNYQGTYSRRFEYGSDPEKLERIGFVLKATQKMPIGNYLLAMSHDLSTRITTALIYGYFLFDVLPTMRQSLLRYPLSITPQRLAQDYGSFQIPPEDDMTVFSQIYSQIRCSAQFWTNPMLLPTLFLDTYQYRAKIFAFDLTDQVTALEQQTGVVFAARTVKRSEMDVNPEEMPREKIRKLTQEMHTLLTEIILFETVTSWLIDCTKFLEKCLGELNKENGKDMRENREVLEMLEFMITDATSIAWCQKSMKERVNSQINVVSFTFALIII